MTTRLYLANAAQPYSPATKRGAWDATAGIVDSYLAFTKTGANTSIPIAETNTTNNWDVLLARFVSDPIVGTGFVTSDTVQWIAAVTESSNSANDFFHVHIYVTTGDSDTVRGTLLADNIGATEWTTTATARGEGTKSLANNVTALDGDRIVVEIGYQGQNVSGTSFTGTLRYGGTDATDLTSLDTANVTTRSGWVEFSRTFVMFTGVAATLSTATARATAPVVSAGYVRRGQLLRAMRNASTLGFDAKRRGAPARVLRTGLSTNITISGVLATATGTALAPIPVLTLLPGALTATATLRAPDLTLLPAAMTASGTAPAPVLALTILPAAMTATGAAAAPIPTLVILPAAMTATATLRAPDVTVLPAAMSATGAAYAPVPMLTLLPTLGTASGLAPPPIISIPGSVNQIDYARRGQPYGAFAAVATVTGFDHARRRSPVRALSPGIARGVTVLATLATASGLAFVPVIDTASITVPVMTATGAALTPSLSPTVFPPAMTATGALNAPNQSVTAALSTASGVANAPTPVLTLLPGAMTATGAASTPSIVTPGTVNQFDFTRRRLPYKSLASVGTVRGFDYARRRSPARGLTPVVLRSVTIAPPVATATGQLPLPTFGPVLLAPAATATGLANAPVVTFDLTITTTPVMTAQADLLPHSYDEAVFDGGVFDDTVVVVISMPPPAMSATATMLLISANAIIRPTTMDATATALAPGVTQSITAARATATGTLNAPGWSTRSTMATATATGVALTPTPTLTMLPPAMAASATLSDPTIVNSDFTLTFVPTMTATATLLAPPFVHIPNTFTASGAMLAPTLQEDTFPSVPLATATATAKQPGALILVTPTTMTATGQARTPIPELGPTGVTATASSAANAPTPVLTLLPGAMTAAALMPPQFPETDTSIPNDAIMTASATMRTPTLMLVSLPVPPAMTATAQAYAPTVTATSTQTPGALTATASMSAPVLTITLAPPTMTATAHAIVISLDSDTSIDLATASGAMLIPTIRASVRRPCLGQAILVPSVRFIVELRKSP